MKSFFFICLTNCLDFGILEKYLQCFSQERKVDRYKLIFLFLFCTITTSIVNMYKNPTINLLCSICMIYLYSLSFSYSRLYYIILPILYIGLGFVNLFDIFWFGLYAIVGQFSYQIYQNR